MAVHRALDERSGVDRIRIVLDLDAVLEVADTGQPGSFPLPRGYPSSCSRALILPWPIRRRIAAPLFSPPHKHTADKPAVARGWDVPALEVRPTLTLARTLSSGEDLRP